MTNKQSALKKASSVHHSLDVKSMKSTNTKKQLSKQVTSTRSLNGSLDFRLVVEATRKSAEKFPVSYSINNSPTVKKQSVINKITKRNMTLSKPNYPLLTNKGSLSRGRKDISQEKKAFILDSL